MLPRILLSCLLIAAFTSCSTSREPTSGSREVTGVVVRVESLGLGEVRSFTLRSEGRNYVVYLGPDADLAFPPAHLNEHLATSQPVRVELDRRRGRFFALTVRDG